MDIIFYHLMHSRFEDVLPTLVERALARFGRVTIQCTSNEQRDVIDTRLWVYSDESFIGHGTECDKYSSLQPVFLTTGCENPNDSKVRFLLEGAICSDISCYQRLVILFDDCDEEQLNLARSQWKEYKAQNYDLTYWQQTKDRSWKKL
ncbi:DNA polymerase III subunit chi [Bartonella sp. F02]|uniref:DNA polymerase III subunit chi n=1 Tax=Bartonella sp. F02 TaxID=2967262 RepID=UPI0022A91221|nr:DNA polymerase III subunit chi [Bartonella sp. F02]MCZ2328567.1 DNA polymerase III subunit chi [Bartonella sp. F02]